MERKLRWVESFIGHREKEFVRLSREIWGYAETGMEERKSAFALCGILESNGFLVDKNTAGIPTAFVGSFGEGRPVIGFLGEFDALEGLSQRAGQSMEEPDEERENGHGCGHNLLGCGFPGRRSGCQGIYGGTWAFRYSQILWLSGGGRGLRQGAYG